MMRNAVSIFFLSFLLISCSSQPEPPKKLINKDTYIDLLIELQLLESYQASSPVDSVTVDSLLHQVFKKYGVTQKQFKKSHQYYQNNIEKQTDRIDKAIERLRKDRIREPDSVSNSKTESPKSET